MTNFRHCHPHPGPRLITPDMVSEQSAHKSPRNILPTYWHTRGNHDPTDKMTPAHSGECVKLGEFLAIQTLQVNTRK